ncbi:MAG: ABC transporter permease [Acidimicrobiales bacterium]
MTRNLRLLWFQIRAQNRFFWRVPIGAFFTLALPIIMLLLFVALFGNDIDDARETGDITAAQFYTPALAVFAVGSATYTNIAINLSTRREDGILRRVRSTPLSPAIYLAGAIGSAVWIALVSMTIMVGIGVLAFSVNLELAKLPAMLLAFVVGSATFATLGVALAGFAKSASSASALANATILPMAFISNIFIDLGSDPPRYLRVAADIFPLKHFGSTFSEAMNPWSEVPAIEWDRLGVLLLWLVLGGIVARAKFGWEPSVGGSTSRTRRRRNPA